MPFPPATDRDLDVADVDSMIPTEVAQDFTSRAASFLKLRNRIETMETQKKTLRDELLDFIERYGYDVEGSQVLDLPKAVVGYSKLVRQRRATKKFNEAEAEKILRERGLWERCTKTVQVLDEDAIMQALYEEQLTDEDLNSIFRTSETYALVPRR